ncbi:MAG: VWA domain-containing protein [Halanaerobiaceae bacterium]
MKNWELIKSMIFIFVFFLLFNGIIAVNAAEEQEYILSPYIWIANRGNSTVSKIDMTTAREEGKYYTGKEATANPVYTAVDRYGDCWVVNETAGMVVKIVVEESENTVVDKNENGIIDEEELLPWGEDESVEVIHEFEQGSPRTVTVDKNNVIWVGVADEEGGNKIISFSEEGEVLESQIEVPYAPDNAVIDNENRLWFTPENSSRLVRVDLEEEEVDSFEAGFYIKDLEVDGEGKLLLLNETGDSIFSFAAGEEDFNKIYYNPEEELQDFIPDTEGEIRAVTADGEIISINNEGDEVSRIEIEAEDIELPGLVIDHEGSNWCICGSSDEICRLTSEGITDTPGIELNEPSYKGDLNGYRLWNFVSDDPDVDVGQRISEEIIYSRESEIGVEVDLEGLGAPFSRSQPIDFVFIIDESGSMSGTPIANVKEAAEEMINRLNENDRGAIVSFDSGRFLRQEFTKDKEELISAVNGLSASGGTDIGGGMAVALDHYEESSRENSIKSIILLSDGNNNSSPSFPVDNETQRAEENNINVFTLGIGDGVDEELLEEVAEVTGGNYYFSPTEDEIMEIMSIIGEDIFSSSGRDINIQITIPALDSVVLKDINPEPVERIEKEDGSVVVSYYYEKFLMGNLEEIELEFLGYNLNLGEYPVTESVLLTYQNINNEYQQKELSGLSFEVKEKPELAAFDNRAVYENRLLELITAGDVSPEDDLIYEADNLPEGAEFNTEEGILEWMPEFDQSGLYEDVKFEVTDGNFMEEEVIDIKVFDNNRRPEVASIDDVEVTEGEEIEFKITAKDPDGDELMYSAGELPPGAVFDPENQLFTWKPEIGQAGKYEDINFYAADGELMDEESVNIKVNSADHEPPKSYIYLSGKKWWDDWFKSPVEVTLEAEDNPGGSGVEGIYYKLDEENSYQEYEGPFVIDKNGITTITVYAEDKEGNKEQPHSRNVKISRPWTALPFAILCQELGNYGEVQVDDVFSNGPVEIYGNLGFDYLGTPEKSIIRDGEVEIDELELDTPRKKLPVPDWEALEERTKLKNESSLSEVELSDVRFEDDIWIYGKSKINGLLVVDGDLYIYDQPVMRDTGIFCTGDVIIAGNVEMDGFIYSGGDLIWYGQPQYSGAIVVDGKFHAAGNIKSDATAAKNYLKWLKRVDFSY